MQMAFESMLPTTFNGNGLLSLTQNGSPVNYSIESIKGIAYVIFPAGVGQYAATYCGSSISVTVSPATVTLSGGQSQQFTATVTGTSNTAVSWSITPALGRFEHRPLYSTPNGRQRNRTSNRHQLG